MQNASQSAAPTRSWSVAIIAQRYDDLSFDLKHFSLVSDDTDSEFREQLMRYTARAFPSTSHRVLKVHVYEIKPGGATLTFDELFASVR